MVFFGKTDDVGTQKIRFINVSSLSSAMRTHADNLIAIHHQPERYTTIAPLSLIIFPSPPPSLPSQLSSFFSYSSFQNRTHITAVYRPRIPAASRREWLLVDERRIGCYHLSSAIVADRHRQQNREVFFFFLRPEFVVGARPRHGVLKNHRAKSSFLDEGKAGFETLLNSGIKFFLSCPFIGSDTPSIKLAIILTIFIIFFVVYIMNII